MNKQIKILSFLILSALAILTGSKVFSQTLQVKAQLDSNVINIGEQVYLTITADYRSEGEEISIKWPGIADTLLSKVEVVEKSDIDTTYPNKESDPYSYTLTQRLKITSFDSGYYAIPPFQFIVNGDTTKPYETEALLLAVNTLQIDTTQQIKDIKLPYDAPVNFKELLPYIGIGLAIILVAFLIYYFFKKKKVKPAPVIEKPKVPAHVIALQQLQALKEQQLWQNGKYKEYHSQISDILRIYIENRFNIGAMEQTTDEILRSTRSLHLPDELRQQLRQVLFLSDLVKFAKEIPIATENEMSMNNAFSFIDQTKQYEDSKDMEVQNEL